MHVQQQDQDLRSCVRLSFSHRRARQERVPVSDRLWFSLLSLAHSVVRAAAAVESIKRVSVCVCVCVHSRCAFENASEPIRLSKEQMDGWMDGSSFSLLSSCCSSVSCFPLRLPSSAFLCFPLLSHSPDAPLQQQHTSLARPSFAKSRVGRERERELLAPCLPSTLHLTHTLSCHSPHLLSSSITSPLLSLSLQQYHCHPHHHHLSHLHTRECVHAPSYVRHTHTHRQPSCVCCSLLLFPRACLSQCAPQRERCLHLHAVAMCASVCGCECIHSLSHTQDRREEAQERIQVRDRNMNVCRPRLTLLSLLMQFSSSSHFPVAIACCCCCCCLCCPSYPHVSLPLMVQPGCL